MTTPLRLTSWFGKRMLALVVVSSALAWLTVTAGYHLQARRELIALCRVDAARVASVLAETIQQRPRLWRYDSAKFVDRIGSDWLRTPAAVIVHDDAGTRIDIGPLGSGVARSAVWGRAEVKAGAGATVWVGADTSTLWTRTLIVALLAALAESVLGALLFLLPVRAVRTAEQRVAALMTQLELHLREQERGRIARDLHDGAGQALTAARLNLMSLLKMATGSELQSGIEPVLGLVDEALEEVRRSSAALMPPAIADLGLKRAIERHCEAFSSASGLPIDFDCPAELPSVDSNVSTTCYRIIQEALTNIARHSGAKRADVQLVVRDGSLVLTVSDDGAGMDGATSPSAGSGLRSIQDRVALLGGTVTLGREPRGTKLRVELPLG
jgi:signal transduction histidine kinase